MGTAASPDVASDGLPEKGMPIDDMSGIVGYSGLMPVTLFTVSSAIFT